MRQLLLAILVAPAVVHAQEVDRYHVRLSDSGREAHVTARLTVPSDTLALYNVVPVPGLPAGQAGLLAGLTVRDRDGGEVPFSDAGGGIFALARGGSLDVGYVVRLEHGEYAWPFGAEEVGYRTPQGVMLTGYSLFLADASPGGAGPYEVTFDLPAGWHARTPWAAADGGAYRVATRRDLLANALFLGSALTQDIEVGGFTLSLVLGERFEGDGPLFAGLMRSQLTSYMDLFGAPPRGRRFLVVINEGGANEGGAFTGSFSQLIAGDATEASRVVWGHGMAHELLHFWNGLTMTPADDREEWFKEGGTDYVTITTMARNGLVGRDVLVRRLENTVRRVIVARALQGRTETLREAGADKGANLLLIYGGGALATLALDVEMRVRSGDRVGLPDLLRALYAATGRGERPYTLDDIQATASELTGSDLADFFAATVENGGLIDAGPTFAALGLRMDQFYDEVYLSPAPDATPAQDARFQAVFGLTSH